MGHLSDWDIDLRFGQDGETYVNNLLTNIETVEVKRDKRWIETGNLFIETQCWSDKVNKWYESGINASKASHWAFVLEDLVVIIPLEKLKTIVEKHGKPIHMNRPEYSTKGYLVTIESVFNRND